MLVALETEVLLDRAVVEDVVRAADDGSREVLFEKLYPFRREREDSRAIDRAVVRLAPVALDALGEVELVAAPCASAPASSAPDWEV
jgi:hypothetical protein